MARDPIWQAFARTGDPLYYLLYCAAERQETAEKEGEPSDSPATAVIS